MKIIDIFEGGIKTAKVDIAAHIALSKSLPKTISSIIAEAEKHVPEKKKVTEFGETYYDVHIHYDNLYNYFWYNKEKIVEPICRDASAVFTQISKAHLNEIKSTFTKDISNIVDSLVVKVEARETSTDSYKKYGGYFSEWNNLLKIFINGDDVYSAAMELLQEEVVGESERQGYNNLTKVIIPVFVHEYAHLEQALRRSKKSSGDFGYITLGVKDRKRKGKRGGYMRSPRSGTIDYLRYKGNVDEIDSFASDAVAELMHHFHSQPKWSNEDINRNVKDIMSNLSSSYTDSRSYNHYGDLLVQAFNGAYADIGLKPEELQKVWKRFSKRVYQKLSDYLIPTAGKGKETALARYNPKWLELVKTKSTPDAVKLIAKDEAERILTADDPYFYDNDQKIKSILKGNKTHKAEEFLDLYYFGDAWTDKPNRDKMVDAFRKLVARIVSQELEKRS